MTKVNYVKRLQMLQKRFRALDKKMRVLDDYRDELLEKIIDTNRIKESIEQECW
jgi:predicted transcriptional regulator